MPGVQRRRCRGIQLYGQAWVLADKLHIPPFQNTVINAFEDVSKKLQMVTMPCFEFVYANTPKGSPLRRLQVHHCATELRPEYLDGDSDHFPHEMLAEIAFLLASTHTGLKKFSRKRLIKDFEVEISDH